MQKRDAFACPAPARGHNHVKCECKFHISHIRRGNACTPKSPRKQNLYLKKLIHQITSPLNECEDAMHLHLPPARTTFIHLRTINKYTAKIHKKKTRKNNRAHARNVHRGHTGRNKCSGGGGHTHILIS
jgi:hypothetical protein